MPVCRVPKTGGSQYGLKQVYQANPKCHSFVVDRAGSQDITFKLGLKLEVVQMRRALLGLVPLLATGYGLSATPPSLDLESDAVGATTVQFRVAESGAATASIPIWVVPGAAGLQPEISLQYSSHQVTSTLGKGWALGASSVISRCRATREHGDFRQPDGSHADGPAQQLQFDSSDRFCLDGQRLMLRCTSNCPAYQSADAIYALETDPFTVVRPIYASGALAGFRAYTRDGAIREFGLNTTITQSRIVVQRGGQTVVWAWALDRALDSNLNFIEYRYLRPSGTATAEFHLQRIRYTGRLTSVGGTVIREPFARVDFTYDPLPTEQWQRGWQYGVQTRLSQRLTQVGVFEGLAASSPVREYQLNYTDAFELGARDQLLTSILECSGAAAGTAVCVGRHVDGVQASARFEYSAGHVGFPGSTTAAQTLSRPGFGNAFKDMKGYRLGDVDGDGRPDLVWQNDAPGGSICGNDRSEIWVAFADRNLASFSKNIEFKMVSGATAICAPRRISVSTNEPDTDSWHLIDYDGDGLDDLLVAGPDGGIFHLYRSNGRSP